MTSAEQVTDVCTAHGEGAVWSDSWSGLRFVDMLAGAVLSLADDGSVTRQHVGAVAACVRPRAGGGMVVATERGFALYDAQDRLEWSADLWDDAGVRMNEGSCDPDGRFWCGSMAYDERVGGGTLYRLAADRGTTVVRGGQSIPNGLGFSPDGTLGYHADSGLREVTRYDYDPVGGLVDGRTFVKLPEGQGTPDGLTVDAGGRVWIAVWGGGQVRCYSPDGVLEEVVDVPARQTTSCTFGGPKLHDLYVTTSRKGLGAAAEPAAGALFVVPGLSVGQPVLPFHG
ncbi:SMP-30/gluconolactonase/LRE family protein [Angustibacter luteus]|uniref:SMP-30/gluconolactonase/LRE family protein n=1 Tax=Angustibacter luteus TaxID=658456 RepID=A0ABW1JJ57_9ACTN